MDQRIYLDFNASTPLAPEVVKAITPFLTDAYGNPSSPHWAGAPAKVALERARGQVADLLGSRPEEIVFTSGGTEANNHALCGVFFALKDRGNHLITSSVEHPAVRKPLEFLRRFGAEITVLPVNEHGRVDPEAFQRAITPQTILVSVMHANNETGTLQPIEEISRIARKAGVLVHTDAAQSVGKIPTRVDDLGVDLLSVAGHKLYGPKGIGALYVREGTPLEPFLRGAGHEGGRRAGTENVALAVGLGAACAVSTQWVASEAIRKLRDRFEDELKSTLGASISINGFGAPRLPNTSNVNFIDQRGSDVLARLPGIAASTGSACHAGSIELSPVLAAMGTPPKEGMGAVRFSLGRTTTWEELRWVLDCLNTRARSTGTKPQSRMDHWQSLYHRISPELLSWQESRRPASLDLIAIAARTRKARVIDIGGGTSILVDALLAEGYEQLSVLDIAHSAIEANYQRLGPSAHRVKWLTQDVTQWEPSETYDVWHDRATFHFLTEESDRAAYLRALERAVPIGKQAIIGTFHTDGPTECSGLPVIRYDSSTLAHELGARFRLLETRRHRHVTPQGQPQSFIFCRFERQL